MSVEVMVYHGVPKFDTSQYSPAMVIMRRAHHCLCDRSARQFGPPACFGRRSGVPGNNSQRTAQVAPIEHRGNGARRSCSGRTPLPNQSSVPGREGDEH